MFTYVGGKSTTATRTKHYSMASVNSDAIIMPGKMIDKRFIIEDIFLKEDLTTHEGLVVVKYFFVPTETSKDIKYAFDPEKINLIKPSDEDANRKLFEDAKYFITKVAAKCHARNWQDTEAYMKKIRNLQEEARKKYGDQILKPGGVGYHSKIR